MKGYRFIDWISQGYALVFILLTLFFHSPKVPQWPYLVLFHALGMLAIHGLIHRAARPGTHPTWQSLRDLYPILCYIFFYRDTGIINQLIDVPRWDPALIQLEHRWLGYQPSVEWMRSAPSRWISEPLYAAYFSFYLMIAGLGVWFRFRRDEVFPQFISVISFVLYASYLAYFFIPAIGPRQFYLDSPERALFLQLYGVEPSPMPATVAHGLFARLMHWIYDNLETWGAAFPSSHVAVAWTTTWFSWRYLPRIRWIHILASSLLSLSTIYCQYHYAVDAFAGLVFCGVMLPVALRLHARFDGRLPRLA